MKSSLTILNGGVEMEVSFADGHTETIKVRQLSVRLMEDYARVVMDEQKSVELFCDRPPGWAETLTRESFSELAEKGDELNFDFFRGWYRRRGPKIELLIPGANAALAKTISETVAQLKSSERVALADWIIAIALDCGLSPDVAAEKSGPYLEALAGHARRKRARDLLAQLRVVNAGFNGGDSARSLIDELTAQLDDDG